MLQCTNVWYAMIRAHPLNWNLLSTPSRSSQRENNAVPENNGASQITFYFARKKSQGQLSVWIANATPFCRNCAVCVIGGSRDMWLFGPLSHLSPFQRSRCLEAIQPWLYFFPERDSIRLNGREHSCLCRIQLLISLRCPWTVKRIGWGWISSFGNV